MDTLHGVDPRLWGVGWAPDSAAAVARMRRSSSIGLVRTASHPSWRACSIAAGESDTAALQKLDAYLAAHVTGPLTFGVFAADLHCRCGRSPLCQVRRQCLRRNRHCNRPTRSLLEPVIC